MKALNALSESFLANHPTDAALALEDLDQKPLARFVSRLDAGAAAKVFEHLDPELAAGCMTHMTPGTAASIAEELSAHSRVVTLRQMPDSSRERVLSALGDSVAEKTRRMLRFSDDSAAALMDTEVLTLSEDMRIDEAMRRIRRSRIAFEGALYVLDRKHVLVGVTTLHALLKAPPDQPVSASVNTDCARILASASQRDIASHPLWTDYNSAAVVDEDGVLLGVIDHRTVARASERLSKAYRDDGGLEAALALGELYWVGLAGILDGLAGRGLATSRRGNRDDGSIEES